MKDINLSCPQVRTFISDKSFRQYFKRNFNALSFTSVTAGSSGSASAAASVMVDGGWWMVYGVWTVAFTFQIPFTIHQTNEEVQDGLIGCLRIVDKHFMCCVGNDNPFAVGKKF
jgi:hypothetical protein